VFRENMAAPRQRIGTIHAAPESPPAVEWVTPPDAGATMWDYVNRALDRPQPRF
jgi:hypothetical protein